jgi:hypothetical protein
MRILFIGLIAAMLAAAPAAAQVYRWVDKDGKVHYSDKPPPKGTRTERMAIETKRTDEANVEAANRELATQSERSRIEQERAALERRDAQAAAQEKAALQERCAQARQQLATLEQSNRLVTVDEQGNRSYGTDAELEARRTQARQQVAEACR